MAIRYYFHIHNGDGELTDEQGMLLSSAEDLPRQVVRIMADIARDELPFNDHRGIVTVTVRDEEGRTISIGTLTFTYEVVAV